MNTENIDFNIEALKARITVLEDFIKAKHPDFPTTPKGTSGTMTGDEPLNIIGFVTPIGPYANVRRDASTKAPITLELMETEELAVFGRKDSLDGDGKIWYKVGGDGYVRSDVVSIVITEPKPRNSLFDAAPVIAPITWGRWDAPTLYRTITNTFSPSHRGIDYVASEGMTVFSGPMGGKVVKVGLCRACGDEGVSSLSKGFVLNDSRVWGNPEWEGGFGHNVVMEYAFNDLPNDARDFLTTRGQQGYNAYVLYGHLKTIDVELGQTFFRKTPIGTVGTSGNSSGFHLHVELKFGKDFRHGFAGLERGLSNPTIVFGL
jgi:hypothetical protein